jgi:hypothetical protein
MSGAWLTLNATVGVFPGLINTVLGVKSSDVNTGIVIGAAISAPLYPLIPSCPGFYSFYMLALATLIPYEFSPIVLLGLGGLLLSLGALDGPETKHEDVYEGKPVGVTSSRPANCTTVCDAKFGLCCSIGRDGSNSFHARPVRRMEGMGPLPDNDKISISSIPGTPR